MVNASQSETRRMVITAMGRILKNFPMMPETNKRGMNATTVVHTDMITGQPTSPVPSTMAFSGGLPRS